MSRPKSSFDYVAATFILALAAAISPIGIRLATGRLDLSPRINILSITFDVFLVILAAALVARRGARNVFFHLLIWAFPFALLAAIEVGAVSLHLADRIAPIEDLSILANRDHWPPELMSSGRRIEDGNLVRYRPFEGEGVSINALGLRTAMPTPKKPGEWRIAVSGGSAAFGWRVRDPDTIPARLQQALLRRGHSNVTVYNFAVDAITMKNELAILNRFREQYAIDQVIFYTGVNDATSSYLDTAVVNDFIGLISGPNAFELIKVSNRLLAMLSEPSPHRLAWLDRELIAKLAQRNSLRDGASEADRFCRAHALRCDFILQPVILLRKEPRDPELRLAKTINQLYPRYRETVSTMYHSTVGTGAAIHDGSDLFARSTEPHFFDLAHVNETGNAFAAEWIADVVSPALPKSLSREDGG